MPQNTDVLVPTNTWTQLTNADVTAITFLNRGGRPIWIQATLGATPPSDLVGAIPYPPGFGEDSGKPLSDLFPGVIGANRVYAYTESACLVQVSHE